MAREAIPRRPAALGQTYGDRPRQGRKGSPRAIPEQGGSDRENRARRQRQEMFRALSLALFVGLRRDEIDTLAWRQIDFANHVVRFETNEFTRAKSEGSEAGVDIDQNIRLEWFIGPPPRRAAAGGRQFYSRARRPRGGGDGNPDACGYDGLREFRRFPRGRRPWCHRRRRLGRYRDPDRDSR